LSKIPEDVLISARSVYRSLETAWMKGMAEDLTEDDVVKVAVAILAERERGQLKLGQAYQVIADLLVESTRHDAERVLDYFADDEFDPDFLPWPRQE